MLASLLTIGLMAQGPMAPQETTIPAYQIRGETELSPGAALAAARSAVEDHVRATFRERAQRIADQRRPFWMPAVLTQENVRRALQELDPMRCYPVVDREDKVREHDFGRSYQTTLWIAEDSKLLGNYDHQVRRVLRRSEQRTLIKLGGTAAFWGVLAFVLFWIDRLSRGYMTGRLVLVGLLLGSSVPATLFFL